MNPHDETVPIAPTPEPAAAATDAPQAHGGPDRIARLFRVSLRAGRVHPLQPMLQRYRAGEGA